MHKDQSAALTRSQQRETTFRLRVNEVTTALTTATYNGSAAIDVSYDLVPAIDSDKIGILDLRAEPNEEGDYYIFNSNATVGQLNDILALIGPGGTDDQYYCSCNDGDHSTDDCVKRKWYGVTYCDGNFCAACSLSILIDKSKASLEQANSSVIIMPSHL